MYIAHLMDTLSCLWEMRLLRLWVVGFEWHHFLGGTAFALLLLQGLVEFELGGSCFQGCVVNSIFFKTSGFLDEFEVICPCSESRSLANSSPFSCYLALGFWVTPIWVFPVAAGFSGSLDWEACISFPLSFSTLTPLAPIKSSQVSPQYLAPSDIWLLKV